MASLEYAQLLRERHRTDEAIAQIKLVLAEEPDNADAHFLLALTYLSAEGKKREALKSIDSAIAIEADNPEFLSAKSIILSSLDRGKEALSVAETAMGFDPGPFQWYAKGIAHTELRQWSQAEVACNRALEIDADYEEALNLKNNILRIQGKLDQADLASAAQLSRNAENPDALANAGWAQLHRGDHKKAEELFRDALRSEPENEYARSGLVEAYKARSLFYRLYLKWCFLLSRMEGNQWVIIIGIYLAYRFGRAILSQIHPVLGVILGIVYLLLVFGVFIAQGIGHFLLFKDRLTRLTLDRREKLDGLAVGGLFFGGVIAALSGVAFGSSGLLFLGIGFVMACIPSALVFRNYSRTGQLLFGGVALLCIFTGAGALIMSLTKGEAMHPPIDGLFSFSLLATVICTWLANVKSLMRHHPVD